MRDIRLVCLLGQEEGRNPRIRRFPIRQSWPVASSKGCRRLDGFKPKPQGVRPGPSGSDWHSSRAGPIRGFGIPKVVELQLQPVRGCLPVILPATIAGGALSKR